MTEIMVLRGKGLIAPRTTLVKIGPHTLPPAITGKYLATLFEVESVIRGGNDYTISATSDLYPIETTSEIVRQDYFRSEVTLPLLQSVVAVTVSQTISIPIWRTRTRVKPSIPYAKVGPTTATLFNSAATLPAFSSTADVIVAPGGIFFPLIPALESVAEVDVPMAFKSYALLHPLESQSIIVIPPLLLRSTTDVYTPESTAWITHPFQFETESEVPFDLSTTFDFTFEYKYDISSEVSPFESAALIGMIPEASVLTDLHPFEAPAFFLNDSELSVYLTNTLPDLEGPFDLYQEFDATAILNAPLPFFNGELDTSTEVTVNINALAPLPFIFSAVDVAPVEIGGVLNAPSPFLDAFVNAPLQVRATLVAPLPFILGEADISFGVQGSLSAPLPFIRARLKQAGVVGEVQTRRHFNIGMGIRL